MNLPNKITLVRIFLIPLVIFFYLAEFIPYGKLIALFIFILASCTDFLDGAIARKRNLVTDLGKFLDPIADKLLVLAGLLLVSCDGTLPAPFGVIITTIIIGRELIISAFRQIAASKNLIMAADKWGKIKAIFQDIAIPVLMFLAVNNETRWLTGGAETALEIIAFSLIGIATALTIISGINYVVKNRKVLK